MPLTVSFGWEYPDVGGDNGSWGTILNQAIVDIDAEVLALQTLASAALPKSGGVMTGRADMHSMAMKRVDKGSISGAQSLDLAAAQAFTATCGGATTWSFIGEAAGAFAQGFVLLLTNGGSAVQTWPAELDMAGGSMPALTSSGKDLLAFITFDAGVTWLLAGYQIGLS